MEILNTDKPEWQQLELLVAAIQRELAPNAKVTHNVKLPGVHSETDRQIDVLVEQNIGQYSMRIVIDCKDYSSPVNVKGVEEFNGLVQDVGAHKGALVCPSGFTRSAKRRAKKLQIDLYSPADTDPHKWQVRLSLPVLCDFRSTRIAFSISCSAPLPFRLPERFYELPVFDEANHPLGSFFEVASACWNEGQLPTEPGEHEKVSVFRTAVTKIDNGYGTLAPVELTVSLDVTRRLYFGHIPIERLRGLKNEQTGLVHANAFTVGGLDPVQVQNHWMEVADELDLPVRPVLTAIGLHSWGVKE